ncbi:MAG: DUF3168 domain-containing protein [Rhodobacteraceae bacterium]|nr:DUF3168 domain-containing protein [Paracoccaceae bacterium]
MEEIMRALLLADSGVSDFVEDRISFGAQGQGDGLPAIVLNTISDAEGYLINQPDGLAEARLQVDCYALSYRDAKLTSRAVRAALSGHAGDGIKGVFHAGSRDSREGGANEVERPYRVSLDFLITYSI